MDKKNPTGRKQAVLHSYKELLRTLQQMQSFSFPNVLIYFEKSRKILK